MQRTTFRCSEPGYDAASDFSYTGRNEMATAAHYLYLGSEPAYRGMMRRHQGVRCSNPSPGTSTYGYDAVRNTHIEQKHGSGTKIAKHTSDNRDSFTKKSKGALLETWNYTYDNRNQ